MHVHPVAVHMVCMFSNIVAAAGPCRVCRAAVAAAVHIARIVAGCGLALHILCSLCVMLSMHMRILAAAAAIAATAATARKQIELQLNWRKMCRIINKHDSMMRNRARARSLVTFAVLVHCVQHAVVMYT